MSNRLRSIRLPRLLLEILRGSFNNSRPRWRPWEETYHNIVWLMRFFYAFGLVFTFYTIDTVFQIDSAANIDSLWPVFWIKTGNLEAAKIMLIVGLVGSTFLVNFFYDHVLPRVLFFVFVLQCAALLNSFGTINHDLHFVTWLSFCFCLLPPMSKKKTVTKNRIAWAIAVFSFAQILICLFYTLSGLFKAKGGIIVAAGGLSSFSPDALSYLVAERIGKQRNESLLASTIIESSWLGWPTHLFVIYFEVFAIFAVFRPRLHRVFGISTAFFHFMVWFILGIGFYFQVFVVAFLFACSPFYPKSVTWRDILLDLPLFGDAWRLFAPRKQSVAASISERLD